MKDIIFIWLSIAVYGLIVALSGVVSAGVVLPYEGAIFLLGASISGYSGVKAFGVSKMAASLPAGQGANILVKNKLRSILIAIYALILESAIVQFFNPTAFIPMDNLLIMAGVCSSIILAGHQAMKISENKNGKLE